MAQLIASAALLGREVVSEFLLDDFDLIWVRGVGTIGLEYFVLEDVLGLEYHLRQLVDGRPVFCL